MEQQVKNEGSPARKYGLSPLLFWTLLVVLSAALNIYQGHKHTLEEAAIEARTHMELNLEYRSFISHLGGVYAPVDKVEPNPYLRVPDRDVTTTDGKKLTLKCRLIS